MRTGSFTSRASSDLPGKDPIQPSSTGAGRAATDLAGVAAATRVALALRVAERAAAALCMDPVVWSVCVPAVRVARDVPANGVIHPLH